MSLLTSILSKLLNHKKQQSKIIPDWITKKYGSKSKHAYICIYRGRNKLSMKQQWDLYHKQKKALDELKSGKQLEINYESKINRSRD